jgi:hypothetical protein
MFNGKSYQCDICARSVNEGENICSDCQDEILDNKQIEDEEAYVDDDRGPYTGSYYYSDEEWTGPWGDDDDDD